MFRNQHIVMYEFLFLIRFYYMATHRVKFTCALSFEEFPFDRHECFFEVCRFPAKKKNNPRLCHVLLI